MKRVLAIVLGLLAIGWSAAPATAKWTSAGGGPSRARAAAIAAPSGLSGSCGLFSTRVQLTWTATATPWADGYEVRWGPLPGVYTTSTTTTATSLLTPALILGTYTFVVRATRGNWRSTDSNAVSKVVVVVGC
jgi:hypothetical protein